jgi:hypothetical protein
MAIKKTVEIDVKSNSAQAEKDLKKLNNSINQTGNSANELTEKLSGTGKAESVINGVGDAVGKLHPAFGSAIKGANGLILKMWEMVANPVGAIIAALVISVKFLYEAFQSSVAGGKELKAIWAGIEAVGIQLKDAVFGLGRALINTIDAAIKFIKLDFKGAAESMKKANKEATTSFKQLGDAVDGTTAKVIYSLTKQQQAVDKARKIQAVVQSETNKLLVQSREILTDETASIRDKKKALEEVTKAEKASSAEKVRIAAEDLRIAKAKAKALGGEEEKKAKGELRELTIALNEAETENAMTGIKLNKQRKMLNRQENEDAKAAAAEAKTIAQERATAAKEAQAKELEALKEKIANEKLTFAERRKLVLDDVKITAADRAKLVKQIDAEEQKSIEAHNKAIADLNKRYDDEKLNRLADTATKKENLDYQRKVAEIEALAKTELEKQTLIDKLDEEHKIRLAEAKKQDDTKAQQEVLTKLQLQKDFDNLTFEEKRAALKLKEDTLLQDKILTEQQKTDLEKQYSDARTKITELEYQQKISQAKEAGQVLEGLGNIVGKQTAAGKALGIASALINTYVGASEALKQKSTLPSPFDYVAKAVNVAGILATGFKTVKAITAVNVPGGGGGGGGGGTAISAPPAPQFNVVGNTGINQVAATLGQQQPVQAFVVANQVTSQQALDRSIVNNASLG